MIRVTGLEGLREMIDSGNRVVIQATAEAITDLTVDVARQADELVPFDTGDLRNSQAVKTPKVGGLVPDLTGEISYGGPSAPYALIQHENESLWHPPKPPGRSKVGGRQGVGPVAPGSGRGPKYLEYPLKRVAKTFGTDIVTAINRKLATR